MQAWWSGGRRFGRTHELGIPHPDFRRKRILEMVVKIWLEVWYTGSFPTSQSPGCEGRIIDVTFAPESQASFVDGRVVENFSISLENGNSGPVEKWHKGEKACIKIIEYRLDKSESEVRKTKVNFAIEVNEDSWLFENPPCLIRSDGGITQTLFPKYHVRVDRNSVKDVDGYLHFSMKKLEEALLKIRKLQVLILSRLEYVNWCSSPEGARFHYMLEGDEV